MTALVTTPVAEGVPPGQGIGPNTILYGVRRPDVVEGALGGGAGLARFVAAAHALGLRVVVDNVPNGILATSPYLPASPAFAYGQDVIRRNQSGAPYIQWGHNVQLDWASAPLRQWWAQALCLQWVVDYGVDGFRLDCEPTYANAPAWQGVRAAIQAATGRNILLMSEATPAVFAPGARRAGPRAYAFDLSQHDFDFAGFPTSASLDYYDNATAVSFVDAVRACGEPAATRTISNHDYPAYSARGRLSALVYGALISPFSPHFYMGEECNHALNFSAGGNGVLYFQLMDWAGQLEKNATHRAFFAAVARAIAVRRQYLHVFGPDPAGLLPINQSVALDALPASGTDLPPYVFWSAAAHQAICVLAKRGAADGPVAVAALPGLARAMNVSAQQGMAVVELLGGASVRNASAGELEQQGFEVHVAQGGAAVLLIERVGGGA